MVRAFVFAIVACTALCASAVVHAVERLIDYGLQLLPYASPRLAFAGDFQPSEGFGGFADPHVERHEARMSRRAAYRGI